jgi:hypothetical protein
MYSPLQRSRRRDHIDLVNRINVPWWHLLSNHPNHWICGRIDNDALSCWRRGRRFADLRQHDEFASWKRLREEQQKRYREEEALRYEVRRLREIDEKRWNKFREYAANWDERKNLLAFLAEAETRQATEGDVIGLGPHIECMGRVGQAESGSSQSFSGRRCRGV